MSEQVQQIEIDIEQAKKQIALRDAVARLQENSDFKLVFNEGYFEKEAARLVGLKAEHNLQEQKDQDQIERQMLGISYCRNYLRVLYQLGAMAERSLQADQETQQQLLEEDL